MKYFIRDFDRRSFDARAQKLRDIAEEMNKKYGEGKVEVEIVESYYNMREKIEPCMQLIDYAKAAIEHAGITPIVSPVRGGRCKTQLQRTSVSESWNGRTCIPWRI